MLYKYILNSLNKGNKPTGMFSPNQDGTPCASKGCPHGVWVGEKAEG